MPQVDWQVFEELPGGQEANFERLCRALVRRHYAQFGEFAALANQPGIEFHLKLCLRCSLGEPGRHLWLAVPLVRSSKRPVARIGPQKQDKGGARSDGEASARPDRLGSLDKTSSHQRRPEMVQGAEDFFSAPSMDRC